jgi:hypothetical protein
MPEISRFFGVIIAMFFSEHNPPHFHARYGEYKAAINIRDLVVTEGSLPPRVLGFVMEWASKNRKELLEDWDLARHEKILKPITPLE